MAFPAFSGKFTFWPPIHPLSPLRLAKYEALARLILTALCIEALVKDWKLGQLGLGTVWNQGN
jgi:hypothetical protein